LRGDGGWLFGDRFLDGINWPSEPGFSLPVTYVVWATLLLALYPACRWLQQRKRRRHDWWLSYL
jgi:hypothetical protein